MFLTGSTTGDTDDAGADDEISNGADTDGWVFDLGRKRDMDKD